MPKYIPGPDDVYETKPCFICGADVLEGNSETCSELCRVQMEVFKEDFETNFYKELTQED